MRDSDVAGNQPELIRLDPATSAVVRAVVPLGGLRDFFDATFSTLPGVIAGQGIAITGPAFCLYRGVPGDTFDLTAGFPTDRPVTPAGDVVPAELPGGRVARLIHAGGYDGLGGAWDRLHGWVEANGLTLGEWSWETYLTQPTPDMNPADLRTELNLPILD